MEFGLICMHGRLCREAGSRTSDRRGKRAQKSSVVRLIRAPGGGLFGVLRVAF